MGYPKKYGGPEVQKTMAVKGYTITKKGKYIEKKTQNTKMCHDLRIFEYF